MSRIDEVNIQQDQLAERILGTICVLQEPMLSDEETSVGWRLFESDLREYINIGWSDASQTSEKAALAY